MRTVEQSGRRVRRRVWAYGAISLAAVVLLAVVSIIPLNSGQTEVRQVQRGDVALRQVLDFRSTQADVQIFIEPQFAKLTPTGSTFDPLQIANGARLSEAEAAQSHAVVVMLNGWHRRADAHAIDVANQAFISSLTALGPLIPLLKAVAPNAVTTTEQIGRAMINVAKHGAPKPVLESRDINGLR